jgi:chemotaxis protein CheX
VGIFADTSSGETTMMLDSVEELRPFGAVDFLSAGNLHYADKAVMEVFNLMFGLEIKVRAEAAEAAAGGPGWGASGAGGAEAGAPEAGGPEAGGAGAGGAEAGGAGAGAQDERTAVVGFSGAMRGVCQIRMSAAAARLIVSAMLGGAPVDEGDDGSMNDAVGELCNMVAGGWKNSIPELSSACTLSPPTVISGQNYRVHVRKPSVQLARSYEFEGHGLEFILHCEESGAAGSRG